MSKKEKTKKKYLQTLSKDRVIELCLQFMFDANIAENRLDQANERLGKLEDILEKYGIESVEELGKKLADGIIWERACELACKEAPMHCPDPPEYYNAQNEYGSDEPYFIQISACEFSDDVGRCLECQMDYFYQQAKGEK